VYLLRCVAVSIFSALALSGCATVSMVSGQALVETGLGKESSSVEQVCEAYVSNAEAEAWVKPSPGFFGLARTLVTGEQSASTGEASAYLKRIEADTAPVETVMARITTDVGRARSGLDIASSETLNALTEQDKDTALLKAQLISFESALITAQKSRRTFITAFEVVSDRSASHDATEFNAALNAFDLSIDAARITADKLANAYSTVAMSQDQTAGAADHV